MADDRLACCLPASMLVSSCDHSFVCVNHGGHVIFWTNAPVLKANGGNAPCLCGGPLVHYCNSGGAFLLESHTGRAGPFLLLTKKDSYHSRRRSCRVSNDAVSGSASLRLDFGRSDHLAPFLGFFDDELAEGGGRAHKRGFAQIRKVRLQLRSGETRIDLRIKLIDHLRRRVSGCANAKPRANLVAWHKLGNRWQVRQCIGPSHCRYRQRAQLACSDVFKGGRQVVEYDVYMPCKQIRQRRRSTAVGHVEQVEVGQ